jgi:hypothetical protein
MGVWSDPVTLLYDLENKMFVLKRPTSQLLVIYESSRTAIIETLLVGFYNLFNNFIDYVSSKDITVLLFMLFI